MDKKLAEAILASGNHDTDERKVMTHGDLNQSNIIVLDGSVTGIVDWSAAGYSISMRKYFGVR